MYIIDYLRIDGSTDATTRGLLINQFNDSNEDDLVEREADESTKMFLISSRAGSVGYVDYLSSFCLSLPF